MTNSAGDLSLQQLWIATEMPQQGVVEDDDPVVEEISGHHENATRNRAIAAAIGEPRWCR